MSRFCRLTPYQKLILLILTVLSIGCHQDLEDKANDHDYLFVAHSGDQTGVRFSNELDIYAPTNIISYLYAFNGGGVAVDDLDNDGLSDIVFTANQGANVIYYNKGDFRFEVDSLAFGEDKSWSTGVTVVDVNSDGLKDIYICNVNNGKKLTGKNKLYINQGNRLFEEKSEEYGLDISALSTQSAFFDYDKDGDLDMYLLCHSVHTPGNYKDVSVRNNYNLLSADRLLENRDGKFVDVSSGLGIYQSSIGYGLGLVISDINLDGWPDIYVGNDFHENDYVYINQGGNGFVESSSQCFSHTSKFSMGCDIADMNRDGSPDVFSLDMRPSDEKIYKKSEAPDDPEVLAYKSSFGYHDQYAKNAFQVNSGFTEEVPHFTEQSALHNIHATDWSWSVLLEDYNLDGYTDIFITNGISKRPNDLDYLDYISNDIVQKEESDSVFISKMPDGRWSNYLYLGDGETYQDASSRIDYQNKDVSQSSAYADLDNDGDLDLVVSRSNAEALLLENTSKNNRVKIDFRGVGSAELLGTKIFGYIEKGLIYKELYTVRGFQSSVEPIVTLGTGKLSRLDSIVIVWPNNKRSIYRAVESGSVLVPDIYESENREQIDQEKVTESEIFSSVTHEENDYNEFIDNDLLIEKLSNKGPAFAKADVDGDGKKEIFVGGSIGYPSTLYKKTGEDYIPIWKTRIQYEDVGATFVDLDNDGDQDLVVAAGSGQYPLGHESNTNRIYFNDGAGGFTESYYYIDNLKASTRVASTADVDGDGWQDVFFGNHSDPALYGLAQRSRLLRNVRGKEFIDIPGDRISGLDQIGMITDAAWKDLDQDGHVDLVVVGSWMPVTVFWNTGEGLEKEVIEGTSGLYEAVCFGDLDEDGDADIVLGNKGLNHVYRGEDDHLVLALNDYNGDTLLDPLIAYRKGGSLYPVYHKRLLENRFIGLKKSIITHDQYAGITLTDMFPEDIMSRTFFKEVEELQSFVLLNKGGRSWGKVVLPKELQAFPINAVMSRGGLFYLAGGDNDYVPITGGEPGRNIWQMSLHNDSFELINLSTLLYASTRHLAYDEEFNKLLVVRNNGPISYIDLNK